MQLPRVNVLKLLAGGLLALGLFPLGPPSPASAITVTPVNPSISVGQVQQFTASGAVVPNGVSAGGEYTCVSLPDGTVQCAGRNQFGQHGDGTFNDSSTLGASALTNVSQISAGDEFGCALITDGTVRCWALGQSGQRGDGTFTTVPPGNVPVAVNGLTGASVVRSGYGHACALLTDRTMRCWGENVEGQLGNGTFATRTPGPPGSATPVTVTGLSGVTAMTTGAYHTCAILADSTARCWGRNTTAQLGDGTLTDSSTPVAVSGLTGAVAISGGNDHTCAVLSDGTVQCWGENQYGQLGDGTTMMSRTPVPVSGITGAVALSGGWEHSCALINDGTVWCWGRNESGQLGNGTTTDSSVPVRVAGITGASGITAGWWHHSCALLAGGTVRCWGLNQWGQFGNGTTNTASSVPVTMAGPGVTWTSSNTAVATIDAAGLATGLSAGTTTITASDGGGSPASTTLTVLGLPSLSVVRAGAGTGSVSSNPAGISCGSDCSESYAQGTSVTLTASAAGGSTGAGWNGCDTAAGPTCTVTMNGSRLVTANFDLQRFVLTVSRTGLAAGNGTVTSSPSGIDCGADCSETYTIDTVVTLTASPAALLSGWSGCDTVSGATCTVTMNSARSVTAGFLGMPF